jgi:hypothetical protein
MMMLNESKPSAANLLFKPPVSGNTSHHNYGPSARTVYTANNPAKKPVNPAAYNSTPQSTSASNSKIQLQSSASSSNQVANPVIIIHQNNSKSRNNLKQHQIEQQQVLNTANKSEQEALSHNQNEIDDLNEVKYTKGYVNVIKERFARKSNEKSADNSSAGLNVSSDFLRRRSVSPFKQINDNNKSNATRNEVRIVHASTNGQIATNISDAKKLFASTDDLRNGGSRSIMNSVNNLGVINGAVLASGHHCSDLVKNKIKYLSNSTLNTAGLGSSSYSGGLNASLVGSEVARLNGAGTHMLYEKINRDELPKPNFVSSVKNLFEKQIGNNHSSPSLNNSLNSSHSNHNILNLVNNNESASSLVANANTSSSMVKLSPPTANVVSNSGVVTVKPQSTIINSNLVANGQYDTLVDRLRQNGTLVYEHSEGKFIHKL